MKYIDLHLHLDGSITVQIAKKLAKLQGIKLPSKNKKDLEKLLKVSNDCRNIFDFLKCFDFPLTLLQTKTGLEEATFFVLEDMRKIGNIYVELRFAPQLHCQKGMNQEDAINAVLNGLKRSKLKANVILCLMRLEGNEKANKETLELAKKYIVKDGGVVAIDLAGAESDYKSEIYKDIFAIAKENNIPITIHAGESEGPESVKCAIEYGASRIGHGLRTLEDKEVLEMVKKNKIPLELCPSSNLMTCAVNSLDNYPIGFYLENGVVATLNTDDPAIVGTSIKIEFKKMRKIIHLTKEQEFKLLSNSIDASFTTEEVKTQLRKQIN